MISAYIQFQFNRAYAVAPHCLPSRNAYMTGRRPDTTKCWSGGGLYNFRTVGPDWVTLPSFFRDQGYFAVGQGKVFHEYGTGNPRATGHFGRTDNASWSPESLPYFDPKPTSCGNHECMCASSQSDDTIISRAQAWLRNFSAQRTQRPFFMAVGLHRPHLPWCVPVRAGLVSQLIPTLFAAICCCLSYLRPRVPIRATRASQQVGATAVL